MLALPYTLPIDTQTWGMMSFTKFFWEIFKGKKPEFRYPMLAKYFWVFLVLKSMGVIFQKIFLGIFWVKKSRFYWVGFLNGFIIFISIMLHEKIEKI